MNESIKKAHPMCIHFQEKHEGRRQRVLMRVLATPETALARQIWESVRIDSLSKDKEACLNLKSEWGQTRTPGLQNKNCKPPARKAGEIERKGRQRGETDREEEDGRKQPPTKRRCPESLPRQGQSPSEEPEEGEEQKSKPMPRKSRKAGTVSE